MTFDQLHGRIIHDIAKRKTEVILKLVNDIKPFMNYCEEAKHTDIKMILDKLVRTLREKPANELNDEDLRADLSLLDIKISEESLTKTEPTFLSLPVEIYKSNSKIVRPLALYIENNELLLELLITLLNKVNPPYGLFKRYNRIFRIADIIKDDQTMLICSGSFAEKLKAHACPDSRIICLDFSLRPDRAFLKSIKLPCLIDEFKDILSC